LTRHELKEQLQHDHFRDAVSDAVVYAQGHRQLLIRWAIVAIAILVLAGGAFWYSSYRSGLRQQDLQAAFVVLETPVGSDNPGAKSFPTEQAKREASMKALASVVAKDGGTREGLTAQAGDAKGAEADLKSVANSSDRCAALAKIALAQLYSGQSRIPEAQSVLRELVNKPTDLVSKAQAQILLAHLDETANPQEAKRIVQSLKTPNQDPAVTHALDQISSQQAK
jgi:hypothetical protein